MLDARRVEFGCDLMHEAAEDFIEDLGLHLESYGFSKTAGRMLGYFLVDGEPHSLDELSDILKISKGSASTNARYLKDRGFLERCSQPGDRRDFYSLVDDPWRNLFEVIHRRMCDMHELFERTTQELPTEMEEARQVIAKWEEFYAFMLRDMEGVIEDWKAYEAESSNE